MPSFRYRVRDRKGRSVSGEMDGDSVQAVSDALGKQGFYPISISRAQTGLALDGFFQAKLRSSDLVVFMRQLWSLQKAGLPLLTGLATLKGQADKTQLQNILSRIMADLEKGSSLSSAFAQMPNVFRPIYVHMVRAGEMSGKLEEVLLQLSEMERFEEDTRNRIRSATLYPTIAFCAIILAFFLVVTLVIPKFSGIFARFGATLPLPTRILLGINEILRHHGLETALAAGAAVMAFRAWTAGTTGRRQWDAFKLKFPVVGKLFFYLQMSRFARVLSDLSKSGVPILQSLQLVADTMTNTVIKGAIERVQVSVNEGKGMAAPMKETRLFSPLVIQMVEVGEQTGRTDELLVYVAEYYQDQANLIIRNLSVLIEPILLVVLGVMVLVLAAGVYMPVWNLVNVIKG